MALRTFEAKTLDLIEGGRISKALSNEIQKAVMDVRDRPFEKKPRKVTLTVLIAPLEVETGTADVENADVSFDLSNRYPSRKLKTVMSVRPNGTLLFNDLSPRDPKQKTIDEGQEDDE